MVEDGRSSEKREDESSNADATTSKKGDSRDVMHGSSFAGANIANTEKEQTRDRQRIADHGGETLDEDGEFVTDAEIEAREERRAERDED